VLHDLFGYFKRNVKNMNTLQKQKIKKELESIIRLLDKEIQKAA